MDAFVAKPLRAKREVEPRRNRTGPALNTFRPLWGLNTPDSRHWARDAALIERSSAALIGSYWPDGRTNRDWEWRHLGWRFQSQFRSSVRDSRLETRRISPHQSSRIQMSVL